MRVTTMAASNTHTNLYAGTFAGGLVPAECPQVHIEPRGDCSARYGHDLQTCV